MRLGIKLVVLAALVACSDKSAPTCEKTVEAVNKNLGPSSADKLAMCKDEQWSAALRNCLLGAREERDATRCFARHRGLKAMTKKTGAEAQLQRLATAIEMYHLENGRLPPSAASTPAESCCRSATPGKCSPDPGLWSVSPWSELGFQIDELDPYRYSIEATETDQLVVRAVGDLDCDSEEITYELHVTVEAGNVQTSITAPSNAD